MFKVIPMTELPTLTKRKLQAQVIGPIYAEMVEQLGEQRAGEILDAAIKKAAIAEGKSFADKAPGGVTSMSDFIKLYELWTADGALEIDVLKADDKTFDFNVTRCKYAETYKDMGLGKIGHLMSCNRDGTFCEGYDPKIKLDRVQTIMGGASCCTFRYRYDDHSSPATGEDRLRSRQEG
jgi:L-2-amino-thiazoline-4-carboxylic acid hydrolase